MTQHKRTILRKKSAGKEARQSLIDFINDRIASLISDEFDTFPETMEFSCLHYEAVWTRSHGEKYIKSIRIGDTKDSFRFRSLDICIVEAYSLEMEDIVDFLKDSGSKKTRFKRC